MAYCRQAGTRARARSAYREAVTSFEQALAALQHLPESRARDEQAVDLRGDIFQALVPLGQWEQILTYLRDAETIAIALEDQRRLGQVCRLLAAALRRGQDCEPALAYGQRAYTIAIGLGDVDTQMSANLTMGQIYFELGDYRHATTCFQQTLTTLRGRLPDRSCGSPDALLAIEARVWMVQCLRELGGFAEGLAYGDEALQIAEAVTSPLYYLRVYTRVGQLHVRLGTMHQAIPLLERAVAVSQDANIPVLHDVAASHLALAYALAGRVTEALAVLEQIGRQVGGDYFPNLLVCGEAYLLTGSVEEAQKLAERVLADVRNRSTQGWEAWALWLLGVIAGRCDPPVVAQAAAHYRQALALAEELGMRPLQAHCHRGLGLLYTATGQREPARRALSTALEMYRSMGMTFWLPQTETALAQVEV
jgi:tetratricopeptide (TPR) repeat protein